VAAGRDCPRKFLASHDVHLLPPRAGAALDNANTPEDAAAARLALASRGAA
jgi:molybdopterin-guanine dinucleotide biosynthesis protein A